MKKRNILSIIDSLEKINDSVTKNLESNTPVTTEVLVDCQDAAIEIGNEIEKRGQEGEKIVRLLEAYCENIYQMNCVLADLSICRKLTKKINKQLVQIRNSVKYNLPDDKKQVVFLPYKVSMWDSLESVWKAADADPNCDAHVIPIPYFDRNPDGSFREAHYEGDQYPNDVPIVSWQEYDIAAEHPDVIYIHNPYDEFNLVTSVHPAYYSKELKKHTDELVYIPYFVLKEIEPDDQIAVKGMEHFCTVPAVVYADKVIVQSEKMRQIYINVMSKTMGEDTRKIWEKKILGLGSPKVDKVLNTRKDDLLIPEDWLRIIEKPDGSQKKIIFYNTSVSALLAHDEKMLRKMESVFEIFKKNQDEVALLWRPHPLIKATIGSMRPQLWIEYEKIVEQYKKEGWGIYDESANMERAVILSDAYYGDESSIVPLYHKTGKPVMVQNIQCEPFPWNALFVTYQLVENKGKAWFFEALFNGLFQVDIETGIIEWIGKIPQEEEGIKYLYQYYLIVENKLYFAPTTAQNIAVYDIENDKYEKYTLDTKKYIKNGNIASVFLHDRELIFVGVCRTNVICRFCLDTGETIYVDPKAVKKIELESGEKLYAAGCCIRGHILYVPLLKGGCVLSLDLRTNEERLIELADQDNVSFTIAVYVPIRDAVWFVSNAGYIVQWDEENKKKEKIEIDNIGCNTSEEYSTYQLNEDKLYLFSNSYEGKSLCIDVYMGKCVNEYENMIRVVDVKKINGIDYYVGNTRDGGCYIGYLDSENNRICNMLHRADNKADETCFEEYKIRFFSKQNAIYNEGIKYDYGRRFEVYLKWIISDLKLESVSSYVKGNIGGSIWDYLCNM